VIKMALAVWRPKNWPM